MINVCYDCPQKADTIVKEGIGAHVAELKGHADLGAKPKSVQPIRGDVYRAKEEPGENPVRKHVDELKWQTTLKGEPAPLQLTPQELEADQRLAKPPPDGESPHRFHFRRSDKDPSQWILEKDIDGFPMTMGWDPVLTKIPPEDLINDIRSLLRAHRRRQRASGQDQ
jgi:hypothetical protein